MKKRIACLMLCAFLGLAACSEEEEPSSETIQDQTVDEAEEPEELDETAEDVEDDLESEAKAEEAFTRYETDSVEELMRQEPGLYHGDEFDEDTVVEEVKNFPEGLTDQQAFNRMLNLMAEDFREEQDLFDNYEVQFEELTEMPGVEQAQEMTEQEEEKDLNVQILIDASGSMAAEMDGKPKMDIAKEAVQTFASNLPEEANVALHVYGHKGSNQTEGKEESCSRTETLYSFNEYDEADFQASLDSFQATGYTPIALAIEEAGSLFQENGENIIYIVSDGEETCGGNPVEATMSLQDSGVSAVVHIIGFDVNDAERQALEAIADAGEGEYFRADNAEMLDETFSQESENLELEWLQWRNTNILNNLMSKNDQTLSLLEMQNAAILRSLDELNRIISVIYKVNGEVDFDVREVRELARERKDLISDHIRTSREDLDKKVRETLDGREEEIRDNGSED
ncbi:vWA domain-containing protein [Alkalicoccobacillus gibsonii]|uniref:vWA domain-containing protein n=1 Tax=Alkalicoccobacillus gibsonii TaxID=79881 RepID=UPI0035129DFC